MIFGTPKQFVCLFENNDGVVYPFDNGSKLLTIKGIEVFEKAFNNLKLLGEDNIKKQHLLVDNRDKGEYEKLTENTRNLAIKKVKTKIYIMIDNNTKLYKIGRSINPLKREETLQSEKPTIELVFYWESCIQTESELHDMYNEKRVRGEWFNLTKKDIADIKRYLKGLNNE